MRVIAILKDNSTGRVAMHASETILANTTEDGNYIFPEFNLILNNTVKQNNNKNIITTTTTIIIIIIIIIIITMMMMVMINKNKIKITAYTAYKRTFPQSGSSSAETRLICRKQGLMQNLERPIKLGLGWGQLAIMTKG